jgi:uncharacterized protein involved in exopolysaccharide biosynthesis
MDTLIKTVEKQIKDEFNMVEHYTKESVKYAQYAADAKAKAETLQTELANLQELRKEEPAH